MSSSTARGTFANKGAWFPRQVGELSHEEGQALVDEARAGSRQAQEKLLTSFRPKMLRYFAPRVSRKLAAKIGAEDLAQRACLLAWQHFDDFRGGFAEYPKWLMQICRNLLNEVLRRFAPGSDHDLAREELLDEAAIEAAQHRWHRRERGPEDTVAGLEITSTLIAAIEQLPPDERQIVGWRLFDELTFVVIAERISCTRHTIERAYRCAIARLREKLLPDVEPAVN